MIRTLVYIILGIFVITILRMTIGILMRGIGEMMNQQSRAATRGRQPQHPIGGALKRDPVCGTFVPASTTFQKIVNGQPQYFCSAECRDKHA